MCRLLGLVSAAPRSITEAVGPGTVREFLSLTQLHGDGWGTAHVDAVGGVPDVRVSAGSASRDAAFDPEVQRRALGSVVHLRWASAGLAVQPENSHPFLRDGVAFAHNGSLRPFEDLDDLLSDEERAGLHGTTDSERYFAVVRRHLRQGADLPAATLAGVRELRAIYPHASLNALLLDGTHLVAVHASASSTLPAEDVDEISRLDLPGEHLEDYFGLRHARLDDGAVVVGSTGFGGLDWQPLLPESVTAIRLDDRSLHTEPLESPATEAADDRVAV
ncbi:class II glutamine amidotransferase [Nocardioides aquiterrae]|uniref:Class II glutamine amidotransferase n=1 Tax=Nocardioides aquiterrae TaxID=203799 RepID=A0ABP4FC06_9ACTN